MITWVVVIGSSLVMVAWIIIYSFFESSDFNDEVTVLFGNVTFWATVVVSVTVSLGRCLRVSDILLLIHTFHSTTFHRKVPYHIIRSSR